MSKRTMLEFLAKERERKSNKSQLTSGRGKAKLNRELDLGPDESIADKFPQNHLALKAEILERLPIDQPEREKFADATARHIMGDPSAKVEAHMGVNYYKIHQIMGMVFPEQNEMMAVLERTLISNGLIANAVFMTKAHEMSPRDAALAAGIFTQRALELKKDREGTDTTHVDIKLVVGLEATLSRIHDLKQIKGTDKTIQPNEPKQIKDAS